MEHYVQLNYEMLIALLQGKRVVLLVNNMYEISPVPNELMRPMQIIIVPPFDGVFLTMDEIRQIQYQSQKHVFDMIQAILDNRTVGNETEKGE